MQRIQTDKAPRPAGHYSQAIVHQGLVFVSGQLAVDPETRELRGDLDVEDQTRLALSNMAAILEAAGTDVAHVLKTTVYIPSVELWGRVNEAYGAFFGEHRPARAIIPSRELHGGALIEIEAVAALPGS